jgi:hypothetical protein
LILVLVAIEGVAELDDELLLDGIFGVEVEAGIAAYFPDEFVWVDALDGWLVDEVDLFAFVVESTKQDF